MLVYHFILLLLPLAFVAALTRSRTADLFALLVAVLSTIAISGFRWDADVDYVGYAEIYDETPELDDFTLDSISTVHGEPGYLLLSSVLKTAGFEFYVVSFLCAVFAISLKAIVVRCFTETAGLVFCLYLCVHFITIEFIQIRWAVSVALLALAVLSRYRKKFGMMALFFGLAVSFHAFAAIFVVVALLTEIRNNRLFYSLVLAISAIGIVVAQVGLDIPLPGDSDVNVFKRTLRYLNDPQSRVGVMSYVKLAMYAALYFLIAPRYPASAAEPDVVYLRKVAFAAIGTTLLLTFVPVMHFRAVVLADLFSLLLLVRLVERGVPALERTIVVSVLTALYAVWYMLDLNNYLGSQLLFEYRTWL